MAGLDDGNRQPGYRWTGRPELFICGLQVRFPRHSPTFPSSSLTVLWATSIHRTALRLSRSWRLFVRWNRDRRLHNVSTTRVDSRRLGMTPDDNCHWVKWCDVSTVGPEVARHQQVRQTPIIRFDSRLHSIHLALRLRRTARFAHGRPVMENALSDPSSGSKSKGFALMASH